MTDGDPEVVIQSENSYPYLYGELFESAQAEGQQCVKRGHKWVTLDDDNDIKVIKVW